MPALPDGAAVDYSGIITCAPPGADDAVIACLRDALVEAWCDAYDALTPAGTNILHFEADGFDYLFDFSSGLAGAAGGESLQEDRVVAAYGRSHPRAGKRDSGRMRGFLGGGLVGPAGEPRDKGHFLGHSLGGGLDVNLFPQLVALNRGWSPAGRRWRAMERHCAENPGVFCFTRPIYLDASWRPAVLEYGILRGPRDLWVERFDNEPPAGGEAP